MNEGISILWLVAEVVTVLAFARILAKAGFSTAWILVPLIPTVLTMVLYYQEVHGFGAIGRGSGFAFSRLGPALYVDELAADSGFGFGNLGTVFYLDLVSTIATWLMFIVFALAPWPVTRTGDERRRTKVDRPVAPTFVDAAPVVTSPALEDANARRFVRPQQAVHTSPVAARMAAGVNSPSNENSKVQYCQWCAKEQVVNALAIHHCGPKDRPAAYCTNCATAFSPGATSCISCSTTA